MRDDLNWRCEYFEAIDLLLKAADYSAALDRNLWDFAVEIDELCRRGLTTTDLRWFICRGLVLHAIEIQGEELPSRGFHETGSLRLCGHSCIVLTDLGQQTAHMLRQSGKLTGTQPRVPIAVKSQSPHAASVIEGPHWDENLLQLRYGATLIRQFRSMAANQGLILTAFQEEGWRPRIDDPLHFSPTIDPKRRLRDTIASLNRNHLTNLIRFRGDGTGTGIRWVFLGGSHPVQQ